MIKDWLINNRKKASMLGAIVVVYGCYQLSFRKTFEAIALHHQLKNEVHDEGNGAQSAALVMEHKTLAYSKILKAYQVKKEDREHRTWQTISGLALQNNIVISFNPKPSNDTAQNNQVKQEFAFNGKYVNLVKLLDTLHRTERVGKVASVKLFDDQKTADLRMQVSLIAVEY